MVKTIPLESGDVIVVNWNTVGHMAGWIETLFASSRSLKDCGILSALVLDPNDDIFVHGAFLTPNFFVPVSYAMKEKFFGQYPGTREVEVTHLICGIIKKDLVKKLPPPPNIGENPFVDADYCLEAKKLGFKTYATANLIVQYAGELMAGKSEKDFVSYFRSEYSAFKKKWSKYLNGRYKTPVMYHTACAQPSGFAMVARGYMKGLSQLGVRVCYNFLKGCNEEEGFADDELVDTLMEDHGDLEMPQIIWGQAPYFIKNSGRYKIGHCEFEGESVPDSWIPFCNMMDEIWVPTEWDRQKFRHDGVNKPIYVFGQGIDPNYFHPDMAPTRFELPYSFKFFCNAAWDPRKNLPNLIIAFQNEFKKDEDVCLIIKTINMGLVEDIKKELNKIKTPKDSAKVFVMEEHVPSYQLGCFYTAADCLVLPSRGEGWGLPAFEALACGIPVITTGYGALNETLRDENGEPLPGVHFIRYQKTITETPYVYLQGNYWAEPSIPHLQELMRYVFEHKKEEKAKALETSKIIRDKFSWTSVCKPIKERILEIYRSKL